MSKHYRPYFEALGPKIVRAFGPICGLAFGLAGICAVGPACVSAFGPDYGTWARKLLTNESPACVLTLGPASIWMFGQASIFGI